MLLLKRILNVSLFNICLQGISYNVQELVECPSIYIVGFAKDSIAEKLSYVETRLSDIRAMSEEIIVNGIRLVDVMRFFHGGCYFSTVHLNGEK